MVSPKRYHVNIGNTIRPVLDPINLAVHADSVSAATNFQAYQKSIDAGTPNNMDDIRGLDFQNSFISWLLTWNQPKICPAKNNKIPRYNCILMSP